MRRLSRFDQSLNLLGRALMTVGGDQPSAQRPVPGVPAVAENVALVPLNDAQKRQSSALMRVNHVGEVCAQALYHGQAITAKSARVRAHMESAAVEEGAHLEWCAARIGELGGRTSLLNPAWYAGAFVLGAAAGLRGDATSLGFVAETERQVEAHLESHLNALPVADVRSRAIVERMARDEARHRAEATAAGGTVLPFPARLAMKVMAKVMTTVAYRI